jgi:hypothetical protein
MIGVKKWQANYIAPLRPPTLAAFRPWGSSAGAGRVRPAAAKIRRSNKFRGSYLFKTPELNPFLSYFFYCPSSCYQKFLP